MTRALTGIRAAILAGGKGTRLASVLHGGQKVVADVGGRPFLVRLLEQVGAAGVTDAVLLTGHRAEEVEAALGSAQAGVRLSYSRETEPLGTGGALRLALAHLPSAHILVLNGDSWTGVDLGAMWEAHEASGAAATLAVVRVDDASRFGAVRFGADSRVTAFAEKSESGAGWINAGVYLLRRDAVEGMVPGGAVSLERDVLPLLAQRGQLRAYPAAGPFLDIGTPETFSRAEAFFAAAAQETSR
jgi:D-glycero-alpha-D-manno-heptose 1-phosphate guanylyltransferase